MSQVDFEVVSHNVNGIGDDHKRRKIFNFIKNIVRVKLQFVYSKPILPLKMRNYLNISGEAKFYSPMELQAAKGYDIDYKLINVISDKGSRYIISYMEIQGEPYVILNCYAPNEEKGLHIDSIIHSFKGV